MVGELDFVHYLEKVFSIHSYEEPVNVMARVCDPRLCHCPDLGSFAGRVSDSGEGRWTIAAAIDESVPAPVLGAALYQRYSSRGGDHFADKVLSALRFGFGGHVEKGAAKTGDTS